MPDATLPTTIDGIHRHLDDHPSDGDARRVLADAYREAGDEAAAEAMEWAWLCGKRPVDLDPDYPHWKTFWCRAGCTFASCFSLPAALFERLPLPKTSFDVYFIVYTEDFSTRRLAEEALCAAWALLPAAERGRLLREARG